ncbi:hypothetical protein JDV02_010781 [Purpureocillium takamizusanense]|uniref:Uncharacterized protein n=1 Tax=Purpureocillium takamizusanense TaxID=2060973 RepID=A0A9Q8QTM4_9HYPO|nr:uncharacterized protein JDV02_010781 [Purpureocillium takamizusanense]UNI25076.1 hypothetical protein JDV02_010781 [Purpureocillium takamizusanense]
MNRPRNRQPRPNRHHGGSNKPSTTPTGASSSSSSSTQQQQQQDTTATATNNNNNNNSRPSRGGRPYRYYTPATPQQAAGTVPTLRQVVPGASVHVVLKEDQPTGRETAGIVAELLTRGDHPRGIKVRLRGGQVGRVQRMADNTTTTAASSYSSSFPSWGRNGEEAGSSSNNNNNNRVAAPPLSAGRFTHRYTDVRRELDEFPEGPPARSLADFMPALLPDNEDAAAATGGERRRRVEEEDVSDAGLPPVVRCPVCEAFEGDETAVTHHVEREHFG